MKTPHRRQFLHLTACAAALPAVYNKREGANLSRPRSKDRRAGRADRQL